MTIEWPVKARELQIHHMDSTIWNDFRFRDDDIIIATYAKAGTTWMQQIVSQLVFGGREDVDVWSLSPWLDFRTPPKAEKLPIIEAQTHRRFLKTHLPADALVFSPQAKYIYIGRDGRDVLWSMHNHHMHASAALYAAVNDTPGRVGPPFPMPDPDIRRYFNYWLEFGWRTLVVLLGQRAHLVEGAGAAECAAHPLQRLARRSGRVDRTHRRLPRDRS